MFPVWNAIYRFRYDILPRSDLLKCNDRPSVELSTQNINFTCNSEDDPVSLVQLQHWQWLVSLPVFQRNSVIFHCGIIRKSSLFSNNLELALEVTSMYLTSGFALDSNYLLTRGVHINYLILFVKISRRRGSCSIFTSYIFFLFQLQTGDAAIGGAFLDFPRKLNSDFL